MDKILIISHKSPFAPLDGGVLAIKNLYLDIKRSDGFDVEMICLETDKHPHDPTKTNSDDKITSYYLDTNLKPHKALYHLIRGSSYNLSRFYSKAFSDKIIEKIRKGSFDFVIFESLFSTVYFDDIKKYFDGKILYRSHNIEHKIWERLAISEPKTLKKIYLQTLAKALKQYEEKIHNKLDGIFSISGSDLDYYRNQTNTPSHLLFFTRTQKDRIEPVNLNHFFHLASMDWQPNIEAVEWFVENVWKAVHAINPDLVLYLAGKKMPKKYFNLSDIGIQAHDYIECGDKFMQNHGTLVVPLFSGSGIRIKVVDALSLNVPIISTKIGVEGIGLIDKKHYCMANNAEEFQQAILQLSSGKIDNTLLSKNSIKFAHSNFDSSKVMANFKLQLNQL